MRDGDGVMTIVKCDLDCRHSKDGECQLDVITIDVCGECMEYSELTLNDLPDKYYKICRDDEKLYWKESRGVKIEIWGREMFNTFGSLTDGRTGILCCNIDDIPNIKDDQKEIILEYIKKIEAERGLSPLYTDDVKYEIIPLKDGD